MIEDEVTSLGCALDKQLVQCCDLSGVLNPSIRYSAQQLKLINVPDKPHFTIPLYVVGIESDFPVICNVKGEVIV